MTVVFYFLEKHKFQAEKYYMVTFLKKHETCISVGNTLLGSSVINCLSLASLSSLFAGSGASFSERF